MILYLVITKKESWSSYGFRIASPLGTVQNFSLGGTRFWQGFWGGVPKITETLRGGGIHFLHTQKKKQNTAKYPFRAIPATLDAPLVRFAPAALKSFRHPEGGYPFWQRLQGGLYGDSEGGCAFFMGTFPEKDHPPPYEKFWTVPKEISNSCKIYLVVNGGRVHWMYSGGHSILCQTDQAV